MILYFPRDELPAHLEEQQAVRPDYLVHPEHEEPNLLPITYVEPESNNRKAVGLDMAHERNRHTAAKKARDSGLPQITGPIVLVQDARKTPGFLLFVPYYRGGAPETLKAKRERFLGLVYAPFIVTRLMEGTLARESRHVSIRISDGPNVLYDEYQPQESEYDPTPLYSRTSEVALYGRNWTFETQTTKAFRKAADSSQPLTILVAGIAIDVLLLTLFVLLTRANRQALALADSVSADLVTREQQLKRSNQDLEQFAFAASHDLRSPLRGIDRLVTWLEEDMDSVLTEESRKKMGLVRTRVRRLDTLLGDLLEYARIGSARVELQEVDTEKLVRELVELQHRPGGFDAQIGKLPSLVTNSPALTQVFSNLIGNALKHNQAGTPSICISAENDNGSTVQDTTGFVRFIVDDNGPGIPVEQRAKVVAMFRTIKSREQVDGSGMGLALVAKHVSRAQGKVDIADSPEGGCRITFTWPRKWPQAS